MNLILPESRVIWLHLHPDSMGLPSFKFSWWAPKDAKVRNGPSRSSKVVDFGTNRKHVFDFLLAISSNLGPILPRFRDIAARFPEKSDPTPILPEF